MPVQVELVLGHIADSLGGGAEDGRQRDPPHGQPKEEEDERLLSRGRRKDDPKLLDAIEVDADVVETVLNVSLGHVDWAPLRIGIQELKLYLNI